MSTGRTDGFDIESARERYAKLDSEELARIAFVESSYLSEAKSLAVAELNRRGDMTNKEALLRTIEAERELERNPYASPGYQTLEKFRYGMSVGGIWMVAPVLPWAITDPNTKSDPAAWAFLALAWLWLAWFAYRDYRAGNQRTFKNVVVVPLILLAISSMFRILA